MTPSSPSRFRRWVRVGLLAFAAWVVLAGAASVLLPDVPRDAPRPEAADGFAVGAVHMHTRLSDGSGTVDDLVDAALEHGLDFIVVSDHNHEQPTAVEYRRGVLVLLGEELSTVAGHVLLLDVDTVRVSQPDSLDRLHGLPFHRSLHDAGLRLVAHPNGRRFWRDRTLSTVDGMEIWNADSEWRNDGIADWAEALSLLPFRPSLGMMALVDRPARNLALLDSVLVSHDVSTTCAVDAHARIQITDDLLIPFPSYRMTLGLVHQHLPLTEPLTGDAEHDGAVLTESLRRGGGYCALGGLADAGRVRIAIEGDTVLRVDLPAEVGETRIRVFHDGELVREAPGPALRMAASEPGVWRVEADARRRLLRRRWLPWILSAPMRVGAGPDDPPARILGRFEDDYGARYDITEDRWTEASGTSYEIAQWVASQEYLLARRADSSDPWTRIDWVRLDDEEGWGWGFCISAWEEPTRAGARAAPVADRTAPRSGCNGFPFTRMRRTERTDGGPT